MGEGLRNLVESGAQEGCAERRVTPWMADPRKRGKSWSTSHWTGERCNGQPPSTFRGKKLARFLSSSNSQMLLVFAEGNSTSSSSTVVDMRLCRTQALRSISLILIFCGLFGNKHEIVSCHLPTNGIKPLLSENGAKKSCEERQGCLPPLSGDSDMSRIAVIFQVLNSGHITLLAIYCEIARDNGIVKYG